MQYVFINISMENKEQIVHEVEGYLKKAKKAYRKAEYASTLDLYNQCLAFIKDMKNQHIDLFSLELEVVSLRGLASMVLGDCKSSLADFNYVLGKREFDLATLRRRAKLYMKMGALEQAFEDIEYVTSLQPDVEVGSLIEELERLLDDSPESDVKYQLKKRIGELEAEDDEEEEVLLGFCNLRTIDRKSVISSPRKKESVYFGEDQIFPIEKKQDPESKVAESKLTLQQTLQKLQDQDIELTTNPQINSPQDHIKVVLSSKPSSKKSILKNNSMCSFKSDSANLMSGGHSTLSATSVKDIEGKFIVKNKSEIKFRKSEFYYNSGAEDAPRGIDKRKSILKNRMSEFNKPSRASGFLNIKNIEGKLLQLTSNCSQQQQPKQSSASSIQSDEQFNIYGNRKHILTNEDCERLAMRLVGNEENKPKEWHSVGEANIVRKSVLKPKNSLFNKKNEQRRTVNFKD